MDKGDHKNMAKSIYTRNNKSSLSTCNVKGTWIYRKNMISLIQFVANLILVLNIETLVNYPIHSTNICQEPPIMLALFLELKIQQK